MKFYDGSNFNKHTTDIDKGHGRGSTEFENRELDVILDSYDAIELQKALFLRSLTRNKSRMEWLNTLEDFENPERFENAKIYYYISNIYWDGWEEVHDWKFETDTFSILSGADCHLILITAEEPDATEEVYDYGSRHQLDEVSLANSLMFAVWE